MAISAVAALVSTGVTALTSGVTSLIGASIFTHFLVTTAMGAALNALTPKPNVSGAGGYTLQGQSGAALDHQIIYGETGLVVSVFMMPLLAVRISIYTELLPLLDTRLIASKKFTLMTKL